MTAEQRWHATDGIAPDIVVKLPKGGSVETLGVPHALRNFPTLLSAFPRSPTVRYLTALHTAVLVQLLAAAASTQAAEKAKTKSYLPAAARTTAWGNMLPAQPQGLGPTIDDRQAWQRVAAAPAFQVVTRTAAKILKQPIPTLTDDLYLDFSRTGTRSNGERVMGQRLSRVNTLVLAECVENRGRFLPAIEEAMLAFCDDKSWVLPAHDGKLSNFNGTEITIDLRSGEVGWHMATARYWLGNRLSQATRKRIDAELERRIFTPFEQLLKTGRPAMWWIVGRNNWNAVCLSEVVGAAMANIESRERRALFAAAAELHIKNFLAGFTPDGYCSEGLGYWNYGFGHYVMLAETLRRATGGKIDMLDAAEVRCIALYGRRMEILPGVFPAFADCHPASRPGLSLMAFLSRHYGWGLHDIEQQGLASVPQAGLFGLGIYGFDAANTKAETTDIKTVGKKPLRDWFPDAGVLIGRPAVESSHALGVAMKGGHNAEQHNHNDVGSFVVALGHATPLLDPGSEVYTRRTFSSHRYDSNVLSSFGHPVPKVAGRLQETGRQAAARVVKTEFTDASDTLVLDLASAYKVESLKKLERTFVFSRHGNGKLAVSDVVEFDRPQLFGVALITFDRWKQLDANHLLVGASPDSVTVEIAAEGGSFRVSTEVIQEKLPGGKIPTRLGIDFSKPVTKAVVRMVVTP